MEIIIGTEITSDGLRLGHTWYEVSVLQGLIRDAQPDWFVEIGVHEGVLSRELMNAKPNDVKYIGIEINCGIVRVPYDKGRLICGDCFSPDIMNEIDALPGRRMIYCDGGNKAKEILEYSRLCRFADIILCHDYDDGTRKGKGLPEKIAAEVVPADLEFFHDAKFIQFAPERFEHTRIAGFYKV